MSFLPIQIGREYVRRDGKVVKAIKSSASHVASVEHNGAAHHKLLRVGLLHAQHAAAYVHSRALQSFTEMRS